MANIRVQCPTCNETLEIDSQYLGQEVECGSCFGTFVAKKPSARRDDDEEERKPARRKSRRDDDDDDDDDGPPRRRRVRRRSGGGGGDGNAAATWALVLGLLSLPCGFCCGLFSLPMSIGAIAAGGVGMKKEEGKGLAMTGMALGIVGLILAIIMVVVGIGMNANNPGQFKGFGK